MQTTDQTQELIAKINDNIAALVSETDSVAQDATYRRWLSTLSRFYTYSFNNQMLITLACPDATRVAGFNTWKSMGRFVKKGEKGIRIFAPIVRKIKAEDAPAAETETTTGKRLAGFRAVPVFDLSQTDGAPLAAPEHNATEGGEDLLPKLEEVTKALGITLVYKAIAGGAQGLSHGGLIEIEQDQTTAAKCGTLAHELAHELLHKIDRTQGKQQRELEAESVAYAVLMHYGIHSGSRFYLASYDITGEMLAASMQTITKTARQIIEQIDGQQTEEGADDAPDALPLAA